MSSPLHLLRRVALLGGTVVLGLGLAASPALARESVPGPGHGSPGGLSPAPAPPLPPPAPCLFLPDGSNGFVVASGSSFNFSDAAGDNYVGTCTDGVLRIRPLVPQPHGPNA
jgi:hypothetical protein